MDRFTEVVQRVIEVANLHTDHINSMPHGSQMILKANAH